MPKTVISCVALALTAATETAAWADADINHGKVLAEQVCSKCHDVGPNGKMKQDPPSFAAIAAYRTRDQIFAKILAPHVAMPKVIYEWTWIVNKSSVDDVIAYILSLEKPGQ